MSNLKFLQFIHLILELGLYKRFSQASLLNWLIFLAYPLKAAVVKAEFADSALVVRMTKHKNFPWGGGMENIFQMHLFQRTILIS